MKSAVRYRHAEHLFYITHEQNIPGILAEGALLSHDNAHRLRRPRDVSDPDVQARRAAKVDTVVGRPLHDYVNLYFRARGPMLSARRERQPSLVVLYVDRTVLHERDVIFTDGNAASGRTRFFSDPKDLEQLDWDCLDAKRWTEFPTADANVPPRSSCRTGFPWTWFTRRSYVTNPCAPSFGRMVGASR